METVIYFDDGSRLLINGFGYFLQVRRARTQRTKQSKPAWRTIGSFQNASECPKFEAWLAFHTSAGVGWPEEVNSSVRSNLPPYA